MEIINILGVNISVLKENILLEEISNRLRMGKKTLVTTPNPEILVAKDDDEELFYILNNSDYAIPDGIGLKFAGFLSGVNISRITGADLTIKILNMAAVGGYRVMIINWNQGISAKEEIALSLANMNMTVKVVNNPREITIADEKEIIGFKPDILLIGLGSPWQEKLAYHALQKYDFLKFAMGVGGSFDYFTKKLPRAPLFFRYIGLEWYWRLLLQPQRYKRVINACFIFPLSFLRWKFFLPFFYRKNVACLLYKKDQNGYKILLVEREDVPGHWQIPQGGIDGQPAIEAARREIHEELNIKNIKILKIFYNLHKYTFKEKMGKFKVSARKASGYRGQLQSLLIAEYLGNDEEIRINFWEHRAWRWVEKNKFLKETHETRRNGYRIFLEKFEQSLKN
jgi:N-acetylglucosaminyldiphosphoundecaprenol N-acetyl-beta-D-mannosaminyltransferase